MLVRVNMRMLFKPMPDQTHSLGVELKVLWRFLVVDLLLFFRSKSVRGFLMTKHARFFDHDLERFNFPFLLKRIRNQNFSFKLSTQFIYLAANPHCRICICSLDRGIFKTQMGLNLPSSNTISSSVLKLY